MGERNHPLFVAYLALQLVVLLWGLYLAWWVPLLPWVRGEGRSMSLQGGESQDSLFAASDLLPNGLPTRAPWGTPALHNEFCFNSLHPPTGLGEG